MKSDRDRTRDSCDNAAVYSGVDNLEVMAEARRYTAFLCDLIGRAGGEVARKTIADFGAGAGLFADLWRPRAAQLTCIEPDPHLRQRLVARGFTTAEGSANVADASHDFIYSLNVLEHIANDSEAARELYRMLKPGGRLLVYVPAFSCLYSTMDRKVGHQRRYRRDELIRLLRDAGFVIEEAAYADSLGFFAALLYRILGSTGGSINMRALVFYDRFVFPVSRLLDRLLKNTFGKNAYVIAVKPVA